MTTLHDVVRLFRRGKTELEVRELMRDKTFEHGYDLDLAIRVAKSVPFGVVFVREDVTDKEGSFIPLLAISGARKYRVLLAWKRTNDFQAMKAEMDKHNADGGFSPAIVEAVIRSVKGGISWR